MDEHINRVDRLTGALDVPPDKSITHRALILSALASGRSRIVNPLAGADCLATARCLQHLGCAISRDEPVWRVEGRGGAGFLPPKEDLDCGNSGTSMRLLAGVLAAQPFTSRLIGDPSLSRRPMDRVARPLAEMGAVVSLRDGRTPPMEITGRQDIAPVAWRNPVASAQVKSAVLLAALHARGETVYTEPVLSRDHTERMLLQCGVPLMREGTQVRLTGPAAPLPMEWVVPGDFSSAAFLIVAAAIRPGSEVVLRRVNRNPTRAGLLSILARMGADVEITETSLSGEPAADLVVRGRGRLRAAGTVAADALPAMIDEVPILAVAAGLAEGTTRLEGLSELRVKETDRVLAVAKGLSALGAGVREEGDALEIDGVPAFRRAIVDSFGDHRIAMAMAVAGLAADGGVTVRDASCVSVSFPGFWEALRTLARS